MQTTASRTTTDQRLGRTGRQGFFQPIDATKMVELANLVCSRVQRPIQWMHMLVPIDRVDEVSKYASNFGIASECGISRGRDARLAERFLEVYAGAAAGGPAELAAV
jgi:hypothetical protein